jgi:hypothetical protein
MKLSEVKKSINLSVGEEFCKPIQCFLFASLLAPFPQTCLQVVLDHLGEPERESG